jgi:hypothetical protein
MKTSKKNTDVEVPPVVYTTAEIAARLRAAGFTPVVRWVDTMNRSDTPLKTVEALTLLDRREEAAKPRSE